MMPPRNIATREPIPIIRPKSTRKSPSTGSRLTVKGRLRFALVPSAVTNAATIAEQGLPGFQVDSWYGVFVPAKTPKAIVAQLNKELNHVLALPDVKDRLSKDGVEPAGSTPEHLHAIVQKEKKTWSKVIREAKIKVQ